MADSAGIHARSALVQPFLIASSQLSQSLLSLAGQRQQPSGARVGLSRIKRQRRGYMPGGPCWQPEAVGRGGCICRWAVALHNYVGVCAGPAVAAHARYTGASVRLRPRNRRSRHLYREAVPVNRGRWDPGSSDASESSRDSSKKGPLSGRRCPRPTPDARSSSSPIR